VVWVGGIGGWEVGFEGIEDIRKGGVAFGVAFSGPVADEVLECLGHGGAEGFVWFASFRVDEVVELGLGDVVEGHCVLENVFAMFGIDFEENTSLLEVLIVVDGGRKNLGLLDSVMLERE
jgi:hypothetical protein